MCCYFKTTSTEFASHDTKAKSVGWHSGKRDCCQHGQGQIQGGCGGCIPPTSQFSNMFLMNTIFSIISNFFDDNKLYGLSTHN